MTTETPEAGDEFDPDAVITASLRLIVKALRQKHPTSAEAQYDEAWSVAKRLIQWVDWIGPDAEQEASGG